MMGVALVPIKHWFLKNNPQAGFGLQTFVCWALVNGGGGASWGRTKKYGVMNNVGMPTQKGICLWPHRNGDKACRAQIVPVSLVTLPDPLRSTPLPQSRRGTNMVVCMPFHSPSPGPESRTAIPTWWPLRFCLLGLHAGDEVEACCLGSSSRRHSQKMALGKGSTPGPRGQAQHSKTIPYRLMQPLSNYFSIS